MIKLNLDCLSLIFNELQTDKKSLHSCLLVNRTWCNLVIPILWKNNQSYYYDRKESEKKLFNIILSCLPSSSKEFLLNNDIKLPSTILLKPLLFNYVSFCKFLETRFIDKIIKTMFGKEFNTNKKNLLEQEIYKLFISQCKNIKELSWKISQPLSLFPGASTSLSQLYSLSIDIKFVKSNDLYEMAEFCKDLNKLSIYNCYQDYPGLVSLIDAQKNLKNVQFNTNGNCKEIGKALARKGSTINEIRLTSNNAILSSFLTSLINLKRIEIYNFSNDEGIKEFQQDLAISEFTELQSLYIEAYISCIKELAMLIGKTKGNILRVNVYIYGKVAEDTGMLIKAIANNCPRIEYLSTYLEPKDFIHVKSLLLNCKNLVYLEFDSSDIFMSENNNNDVGDELLNILTEFSPKSLTQISISENWKYSLDAFERFFESYKGRTLRYFDIIFKNTLSYITEDHKIILQKYINEGVVIESNFIY